MLRLAFMLLFLTPASGQVASELSREQLKPLTTFRQQHRRLVDGRLCAAAFVQDKRVYTGCTDAKSLEKRVGEKEPRCHPGTNPARE
ncbi:unnamed protein product [Effrenium voratum]|nr:unnamed protein product [Effrenium voratum]